ncbi:hypothetical protein ALC53_12624 [Atta colombica]|uniref:Uncharacterized protein n=1 Tax=Atta colombica TaxID=520822 RepID=A0A151HZ66_9HYME|nr:hypothetical protein ALC53_12624 [Atta colombica]
MAPPTRTYPPDMIGCTTLTNGDLRERKIEQSHKTQYTTLLELIRQELQKNSVDLNDIVAFHIYLKLKGDKFNTESRLLHPYPDEGLLQSHFLHLHQYRLSLQHPSFVPQLHSILLNVKDPKRFSAFQHLVVPVMSVVCTTLSTGYQLD